MYSELCSWRDDQSVKGAEKNCVGEDVLGIRIRKCHQLQIMQVEEGRMNVGYVDHLWERR